MAHGANKKLVEALRVLLGLGLIALLVHVADWTSVAASLRDVSLRDVVILFALAALLIFVSVVKWRAFLKRLGISATISHLYRLYLIGYFINLVMPSYVGGDVVRSLYVGKGVDRAHAVSATLLERYTGFMAMVAMSLVALLFSPALPLEIVLLVIAVALAACCGSVALFSHRVSWLAQRVGLPQRWVELTRRIEEGLVWGIGDRRLLWRAALLSLLFHVLTIVNTAAVAQAVGWHNAPWGDLFVVVPLILLVGAIPISPQGLGIQEGAFLFFLKAAGAPDGAALAVGLVLRAKSYVLAMCGGLLFLRMGNLRSSEPAEKAAEGPISG